MGDKCPFGSPMEIAQWDPRKTPHPAIQGWQQGGCHVVGDVILMSPYLGHIGSGFSPSGPRGRADISLKMPHKLPRETTQYILYNYKHPLIIQTIHLLMTTRGMRRSKLIAQCNVLIRWKISPITIQVKTYNEIVIETTCIN